MDYCAHAGRQTFPLIWLLLLVGLWSDTWKFEVSSLNKRLFGWHFDADAEQQDFVFVFKWKFNEMRWSNAGGCHPIYRYETFTWNFSTENLISFHTVFVFYVTGFRANVLIGPVPMPIYLNVYESRSLSLSTSLSVCVYIFHEFLIRYFVHA